MAEGKNLVIELGAETLESLTDKLRALKTLGVKTVKFSGRDVTHVTFFPTIAPVDFDTIVPAAPAVADKEAERSASSIPSAFERILKEGSVS